MSVDAEKALTSSQRAVHFDQTGNYDAAVFYYKEAAKYLDAAVRYGHNSESETSWLEKSSQYKKRAEQLELLKNQKLCHEAQSKDQQLLQRCNFLFGHALDADERGLKEIAVRLYGEAIEFAINAKSSASDAQIQNKLTTRARQALDRAEELKGISTPQTPKPDVDPDVSQFTTVPVRSCGNNNRPALHRGSSAHLKVTGAEIYSEEEKRVLRSTSRINKIDYLPFMDIDLNERFQYAIPFSDKNGLLALSPKQRKEFSRWARPEELHQEPKMINGRFVDYFSIKQTIVSDCSLVASLAVSALYERRFGKRLITSIIYPRNKNKEPIYNPFGKYMVKLHINGVPRKVIIDDLLPVGRHNELLCSYSTRPGELWISLMEKAYMKVMGGYDFPGSNSNIDLHALTGWIPERIAIRQKDADFNKDAVFNMLEERLKRGHCVGTVATGEMDDLLAERTGLVPTHAYAVLDVKTVLGVKLLQLKNPWSHVRWRGNYSELDVTHWTTELKRELDFDPESASMFDNGIFWIDYDSILRFYDVFYLSWNPEIFTYTYCVHSSWEAGVGPVKDAYNVGDNPQYSLQIDSKSPGSVWVLLSRHIVDIADFKDNQEFITVLVYKNDGKKVYYPHDPPPFIDGIRINSPHYLCKIVLNDSSVRKYTLVVSQYEKMNAINYTLRAYSTLPFTLNKIDKKYPHCKETSGEWKGATAGGCANHRDTYPNNPCFQFVVNSPHSNNHMVIDLKGPKQYQIGFDIVSVVNNDPNVNFGKKSSGVFRSGFVVLELEDLPAGTYNLTPSTYYPGQEGPFILALKSTCPITLARIR